jgi:serpin B
MAIIITLTPGRSIAQTAPDTAAVTTAANEFAFDLYGHLRSLPGNLFFSPFSVDSALAMVYAGARGDTATAMARTLHMSSMKPDDFHKALGGLTQKYQADKADKGYELHVANALWVKDGFPLRPAYLDLVEHQYLARLTNLNFNDPAAAAKTINDWVSLQTKDKIKDLIPPDAINNSTRLILTNAIYFKGTWQRSFAATSTANALWHGPDGDVSTPMMHATADFAYFENDTLKALEMPYAGNALLMLVLLPKDNDGLPDLEKSLSVQQLRHITASFDMGADVELSFPKFKVESTFNLTDPLAAMGMSSAFNRMADFSGISGPGNLFISYVVHKAYINLDEEGTEAAAATGIGMAAAIVARPRRLVSFNADHPFLYVIMDAQESTILFMGRLTKP